jgi:hypothetical protein
VGAFAGANLLTPIYALDYRLPLFVMGAGYGLCILVGGLLIRYAESHGLVGGPAAMPSPALEAPL